MEGCMEMNEYEKSQLDKYKKSLESAWGYNDYNDWPVKVNSIMHLFLIQFATETLEDIQEIGDSEEKVKKLLELFGNPARIYRIIDPVIFGMKRMQKPLDFQRKIVLSMLDYVRQMKVGSPFNEEGCNLILSSEQVSAIESQYGYEKADSEAAAIIQRFCGIMWAYTESIFFRAHEVTKEVHGPYLLEDGNQLLIREYLNLQPKYLWDDTVPLLNYHKIAIYAVYNSDLHLRIDSYNHLFLDGGNYKDDMVKYRIIADGKVLSAEELLVLLEEAMKTIMHIHNWTDQQDWRVLANKYADIYWYRKSPFRQVNGKEWTVPQSVREQIMQGEPDKRRINKLSEKEIERLIRIVI